ncbi:MAG: hypothetical protein U0T69_12185 [Chitinophagales bacterium]
MNKFIFLFFVFMIYVLSTVTAQNNSNAGMKPVKLQKFTSEKRAQNATDTLQRVAALTTDQYQKILEINLSFFDQKKAIRLQMRTDTTAANDLLYKAQEKELAKKRKSDTESILTAEQRIKWQEYKKQHIARIKQNGKSEKFNNDDEPDFIFDGM